jgi:hypothetical protein
MNPLADGLPSPRSDLPCEGDRLWEDSNFPAGELSERDLADLARAGMAIPGLTRRPISGARMELGPCSPLGVLDARDLPQPPAPIDGAFFGLDNAPPVPFDLGAKSRR